MVLVDTSVWIRAFRHTEPYFSELDRLIETAQVLRHDLIFGELLMGDRGGRNAFLAFYAKCAAAFFVPHTEVVEFIRARKLHGRGVGWIDIHLLASALAEQVQLWTADPRLNVLAEELGIGYTQGQIRAQ